MSQSQSNSTDCLEAARDGDESRVANLIAAGCDVEAQDAIFGRTAVMLAAWHGHAGCLDILLLADCDIDPRDIDGKTAAMLAAWHGHAGCLGILLLADCDIDPRDIDGKTAAIWAVERGYAGCLEILLQAGCDVDAVGKDGRTAAMLAADFGHADCLAVLSAHSELRALRDIADFPKSTLARSGFDLLR